MTILATLDSYDSPSPDQLNKAWAGGVRAWNGYLYIPGWSKTSFDAIRAKGMHGIAYANGNDDPMQMKARAQLWGVRGCLDVERGTRAAGPWVQPSLDASGFGLYSSEWQYPRANAAFHVLALYVGIDPARDWPTTFPKPAGFLGWQWAANVLKYDAHCDLNWFDDGIFGVLPPPVPSPRPNSQEDPRMFTIINFGAQEGTYMVYDDHVMVAIATPPDVEQLQTLPQCHGVRNLDTAMYLRFKAAAPATPAP